MRNDIIAMIEDMATFPYPQICRHLVALNLIDILEKHGEPITEDFKALAKSFCQANDQKALYHLNKIK